MNLPSAADVRRFLLERYSSMIAANGLEPETLDEEFDLLQAGIIDSLGILEMITAVEQRFGISVDFEPMDPAHLTQLGKFSAFVAENAVGTSE